MPAQWGWTPLITKKGENISFPAPSKATVSVKRCVGTTIISLKRLICLCIGKISTVCVHLVLGLVEQLLNTKAKGEVNAPRHIHTRCSTTPHTYMILCESEGMTKLSETCSSPSSSHVSLSSCLTRTHSGYLHLLPCSLIHLPALLGECRVSAMTQRPTNKLRWERLGSVVGTLLPSLLSLPGNRCCLREGPPAARCLNEYQTKTLATRWVTRVNVGFSVVYYFSLLPTFFFSFMAGTLLYILAGLEK